MTPEQRYSVKRTIPSIKILYFMIGNTQYLAASYVTLYLNGLPFMDSMSVGLLMALSYVTTAVGQLFWGNLADVSKTKNRILSIVMAGLCVFTWVLVLPNHTSFATLVPSVILLEFFLLIPLPIYDSIVVENVKLYRVPFGSVRCFSSAGCAGAALLLFLLSRFIPIVPQTGLIIMAVAALIGFVPLYFIPKTRGHAHDQRGNRMQEIGLLMKNRRFLLVLLFGLLHFTCSGAYATYFSIYFSADAGLGGGLGLYSLYSALSISAEAVLILVGYKYFQKMKIYWAFLWAPAFGILRGIWTFLATNPYVFFFGSIFQALLLPPLWTRAAPYIGSIIRSEALAVGESMWSIVIMGLGPALGSALGGMIVTAFGLRNLFLVIAGMEAAVVALCFVLFRAQEARDVQEGFLPEATG